MNTQLELVISSSGVTVDAGINGAPLVRVARPEAQSTRLPVDWWFLSSENQLTASVASAGDGGALVEFALCRPQERADPSLLLRWSVPEGTDFDPFRVSLPLAPPMASEFSLDRFEVFDELDDDVSAAIRSLAARLVDAFARRDVERVAALLEGRFQMFCAAFGDDLDEHRAAVCDEFAEMLSNEDIALDPVALDSLRLAPCAGGRVFHVANGDGSELICLRGLGASSSMQVYVARVDGVWMIAR